MAELWDLYDENRKLVGEVHERGKDLPENRYHIVVDIWTINREGKVLLDQRHPDKHFGLQWECTGGSVLKGEDSITGAVREIGEELGIHLNPSQLKQIHSVRVQDRFVDTYVNITDAKIEELVLQETEVVDAKFVSFDELIQMWEKGIVSPRERFKLYRDKLETIVRELEHCKE